MKKAIAIIICVIILLSAIIVTFSTSWDEIALISLGISLGTIYYEDIANLLGSEGTVAGSGFRMYMWDLKGGKKLRVWFRDIEGSKELIATMFRIE